MPVERCWETTTLALEGHRGHTAAVRDATALHCGAASIPWVPDIIQANQTYPLIEAFALFPDVPVLSICHDATIWFNKSFELPSICKYGQLVLLAEVASLSDFHTSQMKLNCCITPWIWTRSVPGLRFAANAAKPRDLPLQRFCNPRVRT